MTTPRSPVGRLALREANRATLRGHQLEPWQKDVDRTAAVTWCSSCGLALTVNSEPQAEEQVGGSVSDTFCPGERGTAPTWAPQVPMEAIA